MTDARYNFLPGTEITLLNRPVVVTGQSENGYKMVGRDDGVTTVVSYGKMVELLKLPGVRIDTAVAATGGRLKQRLGGFETAQAFPEHQRQMGKFHHALCLAVHAYREKLRLERGKPTLRLSERMVDEKAARRFIADVASSIFGEKVNVEQPRGGKAAGFVVYHGKTLMKYFRIFETLGPEESPINALVTLDHLKGRRDDRICRKLRELMTEAWETVGLDLRKPSIAEVRRFIETKLLSENQFRKANELPRLIVPADRTIKDHRERLLTPTEYLVATEGPRQARNKRGRGSTDLRALLIGELVEVDECKMSLVMCAKSAGYWERMSEDEKVALEKLDEYIQSRFWILVMIDVATRMPLAWVVTENPNADATLALLRMATRDKTREKQFYGCSGEPAAAVGLMHVKNDNGSGLRNSTVVGALLGSGSINTITRTYSSTERPHIERLFWTLENIVFRMLPGYTGSRPGELPGYDAMANGVLTVEEVHEIVTRYFIDEYPSTRHYGFGMNGRRPIDVYREINETRGHIPQIDPQTRLIQLGWEDEVTPTDEGVRVFQGIWFDSDEFQQKREEYHVTGKVKVYVDPDNLNLATAVLPNVKDPIELHLQVTAFADMTLPEVLRLMAEHRREEPNATEFHDDQVMHTRAHRYDRVKAIGVERNLPRSYSTIDECKRMAKSVFAGARMIRSVPVAGTTRPGQITNLEPSNVVYRFGGQTTPVPAAAIGPARLDALPGSASPITHTGVAAGSDESKPGSKPSKIRRKIPSPEEPSVSDQKFSRPTNLKGLE